MEPTLTTTRGAGAFKSAQANAWRQQFVQLMYRA
jgi:hypothetical protein